MSTIATLLSGLGLFLIGVRVLSASLLPLLGPVGAAFGGAMLPLLVAVDPSLAAAVVIGVAGIAIWFKSVHGDRQRYALQAALGAALLLLGMYLISTIVGPLRDGLMANAGLAKLLHSTWLLAVIGAGFAFAAQSSAVAAAIAVAAVGSGLLSVPDALSLIVGANAASIVSNLLQVPGESGAGRRVFVFQAVQKTAGSLFLAGFAVYAARSPAAAALLAERVGVSVAVAFAMAQAVGALVTGLTRRLLPPLDQSGQDHRISGVPSATTSSESGRPSRQ